MKNKQHSCVLGCTFSESFLCFCCCGIHCRRPSYVSHSLLLRLKQEVKIAVEIRAQWNGANSMSSEKNEAMHPYLERRGHGHGHRRVAASVGSRRNLTASRGHLPAPPPASCRTLRRQETKRGKRAAAAAKRNSRMRRAAITKSYTTKGKKLNVLHRGVAIAHSVWVGGTLCESGCMYVCVRALWDVGGL